MKIDKSSAQQGIEANKMQEFINLGKKVENKDKEKLMEACREFESIFLNMMFKEMKSTINESDFIEKSFDREVFESMHVEELAKLSAKSGGIGLAEEIYKSLTREVISEPKNE